MNERKKRCCRGARPQPERFPASELAKAEAYFVALLRGQAKLARRLRSALIRRVRRIIVSNPEYAERGWLQLADVYERVSARRRCLDRALATNRHSAEAHAELALLLAQCGNRSAALHHCRIAMTHRHTSDIEDLVLDKVRDAALFAGDRCIAARAERCGASNPIPEYLRDLVKKRERSPRPRAAQGTPTAASRRTRAT